ncbi:MAG TPA: SDR family NAD(P)-dependent oxidoreductase, partial [Geminicoccaceae bacterium]|nr:SDR family NAD(P)-dependent oxidoreductase [Geminicoccaceae bacterium]
MKLGIAGRKALVLGGGRGLGLAVARALAAEGVDLVISSRSLERLEEAARAIRADHAVKVTAAACDMSDRDQVSALWKETERQLGQVDILLNNHGGPPLGLAADLEENALLAHF